MEGIWEKFKNDLKEYNLTQEEQVYLLDRLVNEGRGFISPGMVKMLQSTTRIKNA